MDYDQESDEEAASKNKEGHDYLNYKESNRSSSNLEVSNTKIVDGAGWRRVGTYDTLYHQVKIV